MSILNPNLFFELCIRTALNKPIALVRDDLTKNVPFDTHMINNYEYHKKMNALTLDQDILNLSKHVKECFSGKNKNNSLWEYFSITSSPVLNGGDQTDNATFLMKQIQALRGEVKDLASQKIIEGELIHSPSKKDTNPITPNRWAYLILQQEIEQAAKDNNVQLSKTELINDELVIVYTREGIEDKAWQTIKDKIKKAGLKAALMNG